MCAFDMNSPRITAFEIHEWILSTFSLDEDDIRMIQIDGISRQVLIKLVDMQKVHDITQSDGALVYTHANGERYTVRISVAGSGLRLIRVDNLPSELPNHMI
jgi:hypothetical protein